MIRSGEGTLDIDMEEFAAFVRPFLPKGEDFCLGPPRFDAANNQVTLDYAYTTGDDPPDTWGSKPKAVLQQEGVRDLDRLIPEIGHFLRDASRDGPPEMKMKATQLLEHLIRLQALGLVK